MKRWISFLLATALLLGMLPQTALTGYAIGNSPDENDEPQYALIPNEWEEPDHSDIANQIPDVVLSDNGEQKITDSGNARYTVLLLDVEAGFTMSSNNEVIYNVETPIDTVKAAALKFVEQVQKASGTNYVAIVTYSANATIDVAFSTDIALVGDTVQNIEVRSGMANINDAFLKAEQLLSEISDDSALKNIVLFTQGIAGAGDHASSGKYSQDDCSWYVTSTGIYHYEYSNAAYATAERLMTEYNLYSIGLFQEFSEVPEEGKPLLNFAKRFSEDVQNCGYQEVQNVDDLAFVFGELADKISAESLKALYTQQHLEYAASENYETDIVQGYGATLDTVLEWSQNDIMASLYNINKAINDCLELEIELNDEEIYQILLAELLYSETGYSNIQEQFYTNFAVQIPEVIALAAGEVADSATREELQKMADTLKQYKLGSSKYMEIYGLAMDALTKNLEIKHLDTALSELSFILKMGTKLVESEISTVQGVIEYVCYGQAYMETSDDFRAVLQKLMDTTLVQLYVDPNEFCEKLGLFEGGFNLYSFALALGGYIENLENYAADSAAALAKYATDLDLENETKFAENMLVELGKECADKLLSLIPVYGKIKMVINALKISQLALEVLTNADERSYAAAMIAKMYCMIYLMDETVDTFASQLTEGQDFASAAQFDKAVGVYNAMTSIAIDYAEIYVLERLAAAITYNQGLQDLILKYVTSVDVLEEERVRISNIRCHSEGIDYDHSTGKITYDETTLKVFVIACPTEVFVINGSGEQIAHLNGDSNSVASGYETYFYTAEINDETGEIAKIVIIPEGYEIKIHGTGTGEMDIFAGTYSDGNITDTVSFLNIPVDAESLGGFVESSSIPGQYDLIVDEVRHVGVHHHDYSDSEFIWAENYASCSAVLTCCCGSASQTVECTVTSETTPATTTAYGRIVYCASVEIDGQTYTDYAVVILPQLSGEVVASGTCGANLNWELMSDGVLIIQGSSDMDDYSYSVDAPWLSYHNQITSLYIYDGVTSIGNYAFKDCINLISISIGNSVTSIGDDAFYNCDSLTNAVIPDNVYSIGSNAFRDCNSLTGATIGNSVSSIGSSAFSHCDNLVDVVIGSKVSSIGNAAFYSCDSLISVQIPASVISIGTSAFSGCGKLTGIHVNGDNPNYSSDSQGVLFDKQKTTLVQAPGAITGSYSIPNTVSSVGSNAFYSCDGLTEVALPESVSSIESYAFAYCSELADVVLPGSVSSIGSNAFAYCTGLTSMVLPEGIASISRNTFYGCTGLTNVEIPDSVTSIDSYAFCDCDNLVDMEIGNNVSSVGMYAFQHCDRLANVVIGNKVTIIHSNTFSYCISLANVVIGNGVTTIASEAFAHCDSLNAVVIPATVTSIDGSAFSACCKLTGIHVNGNNPNYSSDSRGVLFDKQMTSIIRAPGGISGSYSIPDSVSVICGSAFSDTDNLYNVEIPDSVTSIESFAFYCSDGLSNVVIPNSVSSIGNHAFANCSSLITAVIGDSVSSIGNNAFAYCDSLTGIFVNGNNPNYSNDSHGVLFNKQKTTLIQAPGGISGSYSIPDSVTSLSFNSFLECDKLTDIVIPDSVSTIGSNAFYGCHGLTEVFMPNSVSSIGPGAFAYCVGLTEVVIPDSVSSIGRGVFAYCDGLTQITFLGNAPTGNNALLHATATAYYPTDNATWTEDVMHNYGGNITWVPYDVPVTEIASGWSGATQWTLTDDGVLTVYGSGNMKNYGYAGGQPWLDYADQVTSVVIEEGVTSVGSGAFMNLTTLESVSLPESMTKMGEAAFYGSGLKSVEIPASLWTIQPYTFKNCTALEKVTFNEGNLQKISDGAFYGTAITELMLPDCLDILDVYAFKGCEKLTSITIGSGLTELREAVFYGTAIPTITIPEGITKIGSYAFKNCVKLESVDMPESLTSVGEASFYACTALKTVELPDAVTTIGNYAFRKCAAITVLTFGSELVTIGECAFYGCTSLTELVIPDKVTTIKPYAFKTCTGLTSVTLDSNVTTIGEGAFNTCMGLKTIVFPASLTSIGDYCFSGSYNLWQMTFEGDAPSIGTGAFKGLAATAYYPSGNATWTAENMLNYGGTITWKAAGSTRIIASEAVAAI